jgi:23S rRNA (cytidine1920-2'-O)/16S rRNA (cytidine1409-2'-O)-methyltransferase
MTKNRLDHLLVQRKLVPTRSQAESYIRLGQVKVEGKVIKKPGYFASENAVIEFGATEQYVSRAALKLASVATTLQLDFKNKVVLDVGSSTGGFTDYALQHGATKSIAVDVGTQQLHPRLREDSRVELHEKTDIRKVRIKNDSLVRHPEPAEGSSIEAERSFDVAQDDKKKALISQKADIAVIDVSFISMTMVLGSVGKLVKKDGQIVAMLKPQFEAGREQLNKGIVKNSAHRRDILQNFESWCRANKFVILKKSDSAVAGEKGNVERFYLLKAS